MINNHRFSTIIIAASCHKFCSNLCIQKYYFYGNLVLVNYIATTFMHPTGNRRNFRRYSGSAVDVQGIPYDFDSLMHYGAYTFAINRNIPVIRPRSRSISINRFGQRNRLSPYDIMQVNIKYCPGTAATVMFRHRHVM